MKRFSQCVCLILIVAMVFAMPVFATEAVEQRSSAYFMKFSVYLWEIEGSKFEVWFDVTAVESMDELGTKTIKVQRSTDEENWTTVKTYQKADYSQMVASNKVAYANCVTYSYTNGYYYRAVIVLYAKKGTGTGELTVVTPTVDKT